MRIGAGTSGFAYPEWKGSFYPEALAEREWLSFYAGKLPTVEINNTFYRMPSSKVLAGWVEQVGPEFRFAVKASRFITHIRRLKDIGESVAYLEEKLVALGDRIGPVLYQLPPNLKLDLDRLDAFLALPATAGRRIALEFRHPSWRVDEVYRRLGERDVALVTVDGGGEDEASPLVRTASWCYLRLRREEYTDADLGEWRRRVAALGVGEAYVYFKHEDAGAGPRLAARFLALAREVDGEA